MDKTSDQLMKDILRILKTQVGIGHNAQGVHRMLTTRKSMGGILPLEWSPGLKLGTVQYRLNRMVKDGYLRKHKAGNSVFFHITDLGVAYVG